MKKLLLVCLLTSAASAYLMGMEKEQEKPRAGQIENLPIELWSNIIFLLTKAQTAGDAVRDIKNLSLTNKEFYKLLQDQDFVDKLVKEISSRFGTNGFGIEILLGSPWAKEYLARLLQELKNNSEKGEGALAAAIMKSGSLHAVNVILNYLLRHGDIKDISGALAIPFYFKMKEEKLMKFLELFVNKGFDINSFIGCSGQTPLLLAIEGGMLKTAEKILSYGADVNLAAPLSIAIKKAQKEPKYLTIVKLLLQKGAMVTNEDLENAQGNPEIVNLLKGKEIHWVYPLSYEDIEKRNQSRKKSNVCILF